MDRYAGWREFLSLFVPGIPAPGGSKKAFLNPKTGRIVVTDDAKRNKPWRQAVEAAAFAAMDGRAPIARGVPIALSVTFLLPRPKGHYGTGRNAGTLRPNAPMFHDVRPDATKLLRALEDAGTGVLWHDDCAIVEQFVSKRFTDGTPGAQVMLSVWVDGRGGDFA
jgi:crossover junction endodeoxyribonuclease RusA